MRLRHTYPINEPLTSLKSGVILYQSGIRHASDFDRTYPCGQSYKAHYDRKMFIRLATGLIPIYSEEIRLEQRKLPKLGNEKTTGKTKNIVYLTYLPTSGYDFPSRRLHR